MSRCRAQSTALLVLVVACCIAPVVHTKGDDFGVLAVPKGGEEEIQSFVRRQMEPRHAVAVFVGAQGKRRALLEELAQDENLKHVATFGAQPGKGSTLTVHAHGYGAEAYEGKWTRSALRAWLLRVGYPLVNRMQYQFAPPKYLSNNEVGTVLILRPLGAADVEELVTALEPFAERFRDRLKFTMFTKAPATQQLCDTYGIWSNDELLVLEEPSKVAKRQHSHTPSGRKFRLRGVTQNSLQDFFQAYEAGKWPRHYLSDALRVAEPVVPGGVRELTGWNFAEVVEDPKRAVLVMFVSEGCGSCKEYKGTYEQVARAVSERAQKAGSPWQDLVVARIDQSKNEHSEWIKGTPALRFWPRGPRGKRPLELDPRDAESLVSFLEEQVVDEASGDAGARSGRGREL